MTKSGDAVNADAAHTFVVGDSFDKDIVPAASLGCKTIWVRGRDWEDKHYDTSCATFVVDNLTDILPLIEHD